MKVKILKNVVIGQKVLKKDQVVELDKPTAAGLITKEFAEEDDGDRDALGGDIAAELMQKSVPELMTMVGQLNARAGAVAIVLPANVRKAQIVEAIMAATGYKTESQ